MKRLGVLIAAVASVLATEAHAQMTTFKVRIDNVSHGTMLRSPREPFPLSHVS